MNACLEQGKQDSIHFANEAWYSIEQTSDELLDPSRRATVELFDSIDEWFNQMFSSK